MKNSSKKNFSGKNNKEFKKKSDSDFYEKIQIVQKKKKDF